MAFPACLLACWLASFAQARQDLFPLFSPYTLKPEPPLALWHMDNTHINTHTHTHTHTHKSTNHLLDLGLEEPVVDPTWWDFAVSSLLREPEQAQNHMRVCVGAQKGLG